MESIVSWISEWPLAVAIREGFWAFPIIESIHVLALTAVVGCIAMVDLRLLGIATKKIPVTRLAADLLPITWVAFAIAALTGALLLISSPGRYLINFSFQMKFALMAIAGLNMVFFHLLTWRGVSAWDSRLPPPAAVRIAGAVSLVTWLLVIGFARWVGFTLSYAWHSPVSMPPGFITSINARSIA